MRRIPSGSALLLVLLIVAGIRPSMLRLMVPRASGAVEAGPIDGLDRKPLRFRADPGPPELIHFAENIRNETRRGDTIAVLYPPPFDGFSYAYWRTSYLLSGRLVLLPLAAPDLDHAKYVAVRGVPFADPRFDHVWSGAAGETLWRRR